MSHRHKWVPDDYEGFPEPYMWHCKCGRCKFVINKLTVYINTRLRDKAVRGCIKKKS